MGCFVSGCGREIYTRVLLHTVGRSPLPPSLLHRSAAATLATGPQLRGCAGTVPRLTSGRCQVPVRALGSNSRTGTPLTGRGFPPKVRKSSGFSTSTTRSSTLGRTALPLTALTTSVGSWRSPRSS